MLLGGAWAQDALGAAPAKLFEAGWTSKVFFQIFDRESERFLTRPAGDLLGAADVLRRVRMPLGDSAVDYDPRRWTSRPYALPAGSFFVEGVAAPGSALSNGLGCFASGELAFDSRVGLAQFRLRARHGGEAPRVRMLEARPTRVTAVHSVLLRDGSRIHGLDDEAYLDPRGFWVKAASKADFALEPSSSCRAGCRFEIANGGVENFVEMAGNGRTERLRLRPWAATELLLESEAEVVLFSIESERGFRPSEVEPGNPDRRALGVFLRAPDVCGREP